MTGEADQPQPAPGPATVPVDVLPAPSGLPVSSAAQASTQLELLPADHLPGLELTPLGAKVTGTVDQGAVLTRLRAYRGFGASWRWLMGDLVCSLAAGHDGDLAYAWQLVADEDLDSRSSLSRSVAVARMVPLDRRRASLSWSHHEAVLAADPRRQHSTPIEQGDERDLLLERAVTERWTVDRLERHIAEQHAGDQDPLPDMPPSRPPWRAPKTLTELDRVLGSHDAAVVRADGTVTVHQVHDVGGSETEAS